MTAEITVLDIAAELCPMSYVRTRLALDRLAPGAVLRVHLGNQEARHNAAANALRLGHRVLADEPDGQGGAWLTLQKHF
jgi:TusA-related sulfurtransferase